MGHKISGGPYRADNQKIILAKTFKTVESENGSFFCEKINNLGVPKFPRITQVCMGAPAKLKLSVQPVMHSFGFCFVYPNFCPLLYKMWKLIRNSE